MCPVCPGAAVASSASRPRPGALSPRTPLRAAPQPPLSGRSLGMAPSPVMKDLGAAALVGVPKNSSFGEGSSVRRPGRLRVVHPDVAEFLRTSPRLWRPRRPTPPSSPRAVAGDGDDGEEEKGGARARYDCAFEDDKEEARGFAPPRLVWGKVKSHPWWPGQVFDPADASELAQRQQRRRGAVLVAHFWDKSFAWTDPAALRPFRAGFRRFAAQSAHSTFAASVDAALDEVARRVDVGLSCCCGVVGNNNMAVAKKQVIDNAGVRDGAYGAAVDAAFARRAFRGEAFVGYVSALAAAPMAGADRVDLTIATAQLKAFSRWRGSRDLPEYTYFYGIDGVAMDAAPARAKKRRRSRSGGEFGDDSGRGKMSRLGASWKNNAACESVDDTLELVDLEASPQPKTSQQTPTRMGMLMSRAAQQMSRSPVVLRADGNAPEVVSHMEKCTSAVDELPPVNNGGLKDAHTSDAPLVNEQAGLVLNFSSASAVPSTTYLTMIFSRFGPIKEASAENSAALVIFRKRAHAEEAFARTGKIRAISASLISFRLTYSLPPATMDSPESEPDSLPVEPVQ